MDLFSWSDYEDIEISEKTKYWIDLWEETVEGFSNNVYDKDLVNPHLILIYLIEEIKHNKLMNIKNNDYFIEKINFFVKNDIVIKNLFKTDFLLLISELSSKFKRFEYFRILCEEILNVFQKGIYFKESCDQLKEIILDTQWKDGDETKIFLISQSLIIELMLAEYNLETIKTIPRSLFDKYYILDTDSGELISTKYPTSLNIKDFYEEGKLNQISYNEALKTEINSLSVSDRIERLKCYFDKGLFEGYGIFHIEGLKGNTDITVGEVNFYSPKIESYWRVIKNPEIETNCFDEKKLEFVDDEEPYSVERNKEILFRDFESKVKQNSFINAAVKIKYRDFESARVKALEIVERSLDLFRLHIVSEIPFRVKTQKFYLVNCEDLRVFDSFSAKGTPHYKEMLSYNFNNSTLFSDKNEKYLMGVKKLLFNEDIEKYPLSTKLAYSLHWYRKAFETDLPEDQLLSYWIAIENLLTFDSKNGNLVLRDQEERDKFILVQELVPFIELHHSIKKVAIDTYLYLKKLISNSQISSSMGSTTKTLDIPQNCLEACQLKHQIDRKDIDLIKFIQTLPLLYPHITRKAVENKIKYSENFYNDTKLKSSELQRKLEQTRNDLLLLYRYRNLIVHNARFDNKILPYYVKKAENLAGNLIRTVLYEHTMDSTKSQQEILIYEKVRMEMIIEKLGKSEHVDFWKL